tara:strand:- start:313 stop:498 length:186 start_codon:yes stop_codon:yes gene_type:complete
MTNDPTMRKIMSNQQNTELLEKLYEEELEWIMNNKPTNSTQEQLESFARHYATKRFEDLCQ